MPDIPAPSAAEREALLETLAARFAKHPARHPGLAWPAVRARLEARPDKVASLHAMERTGGEPDVVVFDDRPGDLVFVDCAAESPPGRRSLCYDREALDARKESKPAGAATQLAEAMGIVLPTESEYRALQQLGAFDTKTSSWLATPPAIRQLGGAIFGDRRYGQVFVYHNGASSYYAVRGFRGLLTV